MPKQKAGSIRLLVHEKLVSVELSKDCHIIGYAFGSDRSGNIVVCLRKFELEAAGIACQGPCINRLYAETKVTFLDASKMPIVEMKEEDNGHDSDSDGDTDTGTDGDLLGDSNKDKKERKKRKVKNNR